MKENKTVVVLGTGRMGRVIAHDLSSEYKIIAVDTKPDSLGKLTGLPNINTVWVASTGFYSTMEEIISKGDLVVLALPGSVSFRLLKEIIKMGKSVVDISYFPEDYLELKKAALAYGGTAVIDCGVAPGLSNMVIGYYHQRLSGLSLSGLSEVVCYVGGLPKARVSPYEYKAMFSPEDVIEIYTRPAKIKRNGTVIEVPALSETERVNFDKVGTLEAFITDGLRTLVRTMPIPNMVEKTLRYPGHGQLMRIFKESGFFAKEPIDFGGVKISPREFTSRLLFPLWHLDNDDDLTLMRVEFKDGDSNATKFVFEMYDERDQTTGFSSMARVTGFTCAATARLILEGVFDKKGIFPPEMVGMHGESFDYVLNYLTKKRVVFTLTYF